jgi:TonB family protein
MHFWSRKKLDFERSIHMFGKLLVFVALSFEAASAQTIGLPQPSRVLIGSGDGENWKITEVVSVSQSESRLRHISADFNCEEPHVSDVEDFYFYQNSVKELVSKADVCVSESMLSSLVLSLRIKKKHSDEDDEADDADGNVGRQRMEVQCGTDVVVHDLPGRESFRFSILKRKQPRLAALWDVAGDLDARAKELRRTELSETEREQAEINNREDKLSAAAEIRDGKFDLVLEEVAKQHQNDGRTKLSQFMPSPEAAIDRENYGEVENVDQLGLAKIADRIPYPQMAVIAHIQGDVKVEISVDYASGRVLSTTPSSGHPILRMGAMDAIHKWLFVAPYSGPNPFSVNVHFKVRCAPLLNTSRTRVATRVAKKKNKSKR